MSFDMDSAQEDDSDAVPWVAASAGAVAAPPLMSAAGFPWRDALLGGIFGPLPTDPAGISKFQYPPNPGFVAALNAAIEATGWSLPAPIGMPWYQATEDLPINTPIYYDNGVPTLWTEGARAAAGGSYQFVNGPWPTRPVWIAS